MSNLEKRTFTTQEIKDFIAQWKESGLSKKKFADQHGLKYYTFIAWFEKHGRGDILNAEKILYLFGNVS